MEFQRAVALLSTTDAAEVPVLASVYGQPEPRRFVLKKTFVEPSYTTLHLQTYPSTLPCPLSPYLTSTQRHHFNHPATAPATTPIVEMLICCTMFSPRLRSTASGTPPHRAVRVHTSGICWSWMTSLRTCCLPPNTSYRLLWTLIFVRPFFKDVLSGTRLA